MDHHQTSIGYLPVKNAARWAGVSLQTLNRWISWGLPVYQGTPGGKRLIRLTDVDAFLIRRHVPSIDLGQLVGEVVEEVLG